MKTLGAAKAKMEGFGGGGAHIRLHSTIKFP